MGLQTPTMFSLSLFHPSDQPTVKALILSGLVEHWGTLDPEKNPDLDDIAASYKDAHFLVARLDGEIVGCGALVPRTAEEAEIVRMSVAAHMRRQGIGRQILQALCDHAREQGFRRVVLETTADWSGVITFYQRFGFHLTHHKDGDAYFELNLTKDVE